MANQNIEGILLVDKPAGCTSFDVVAQVRRQFNCKAVGHTGTLDPFATGLLVLLLGRYTRLCDYLTAQHKTYEATVCLGVGTDTDDCDGQVIAQVDASRLTPEQIEQAVQSFLGPQLQMPPQYSAISIEGERAYKKARRGEQIDLAPRPIEVYEIQSNCHSGLEPESREPWTLGQARGDNFTASTSLTLHLRVSKGTYIRAIARDLGHKLGVPAHLTALRRTACGSYELSEVNGRLMTGIQAIRDFPIISLDQASAEALRKGQRSQIPPNPSFSKGGRGLACLGEEPIAVVEILKDHLKPVRGF